MRLVLASNNAKKLVELKALFGGLPIELVAQGTLGIAEAEEPHVTFVENALAKARHAAQASGGAAIADDSGLCVDALGGAPGVQSAVYAPARRRGEERAQPPRACRRADDSPAARELASWLRACFDSSGRAPCGWPRCRRWRCTSTCRGA